MYELFGMAGFGHCITRNEISRKNDVINSDTFVQSLGNLSCLLDVKIINNKAKSKVLSYLPIFV